MTKYEGLSGLSIDDTDTEGVHRKMDMVRLPNGNIGIRTTTRWDQDTPPVETELVLTPTSFAMLSGLISHAHELPFNAPPTSTEGEG